MSKFSQKRYRIGELSSKYAYDKTGEQFEADIQRHKEEVEHLYIDFVGWMKVKNVTPEKFRMLFARYYNEFIK